MVKLHIVLAIGIISAISILFLSRRQYIVDLLSDEQSGYATSIEGGYDTILFAFALLLFVNIVFVIERNAFPPLLTTQ